MDTKNMTEEQILKALHENPELVKKFKRDQKLKRFKCPYCGTLHDPKTMKVTENVENKWGGKYYDKKYTQCECSCGELYYYNAKSRTPVKYETFHDCEDRRIDIMEDEENGLIQQVLEKAKNTPQYKRIMELRKLEEERQDVLDKLEEERDKKRGTKSKPESDDEEDDEEDEDAEEDDDDDDEEEDDQPE